MALKTKTLIEKQTGDLIRDGFYLFTKNYGKIIFPFTLFSILAILVKTFLLSDLEWMILDLSQGSYDYYQGLFRLLIALYLYVIIDPAIKFLFSIIAMSLVGTYLYKRYINEQTNFKDEIKSALNLRILIPIFLVGFGFLLGIIFFMVSAFIILGYFIFTIYTFNMELEQDTIRAARYIEKGAFWSIMGVLVLSYLLTIIAEYFLYLLIRIFWRPRLYVWLNPLNRNYLMLFLHYLLNDLSWIILSPLFICLLTPLFAYQKNLKENPSLKPEQSKKRIKQGKFCPYCGDYMSVLKNYCPNCGEKIDFL